MAEGGNLIIQTGRDLPPCRRLPTWILGFPMGNCEDSGLASHANSPGPMGEAGGPWHLSRPGRPERFQLVYSRNQDGKIQATREKGARMLVV